MKNPELRAQFKQFANTDKTIKKDDMIEFVDMRGQTRPADWPKDGQPQTNWKVPVDDIFAKSQKSWIEVGSVSDFVPNVGTPILYGDSQLAIFNNERRGEWYCTQNMCPHKQAFASAFHPLIVWGVRGGICMYIGYFLHHSNIFMHYTKNSISIWKPPVLFSMRIKFLSFTNIYHIV